MYHKFSVTVMFLYKQSQSLHTSLWITVLNLLAFLYNEAAQPILQLPKLQHVLVIIIIPYIVIIILLFIKILAVE